jgi:hypothetical protein
MMQNRVAHRGITMTMSFSTAVTIVQMMPSSSASCEGWISSRAVDYSISTFATARNTVSAAPNVAASMFAECVA